ncbi:restriction endonuclease subunit S [Gemella sp. zg-1178]|uniref:restriction endonuclease subunit S n=1 Tax=Gemella sp. zg-1178 TaxID=2840372 RepID=UPI001C03E6D8|nr:restriction endonuclease subunit S [Gemella sp. zg-1178]MBU0278208.1 restriction endonuclease subunit S [Gemella sp. zg-1178]
MKKYEKYKEIKLPWLKEVPEHWEILKNRNIFKYRKELNKNNIEKNVLSLTLNGVINNDIENPIGLSPKNYETYQLFNKDDLVFKLIDLNNVKTSRVGIVHEKGIMSPAYIRFTSDKNKNFPKYYYYWFYRLYIEEVFNKLGNGVRETIGKNELLNMVVPSPSYKEQSQIANFLDWKIGEIDRLVGLEKRKVERLGEYRKNFLSYLMKNEKNCNLISLKNILKIKSIKKSQNVGDLDLLSVVRDKGIVLRNLDYEDENHNVIPEDLSNYKVVFKNDFVMNKMKAWQGSYGISKLKGVVSPAYFVFEFTSKDILPDFFHLSIRCRNYIDEFAKYSKGIRVGQWDFDLSEIRNIYFKYPNIDRQVYIINKVKTTYKKLDEIISKTTNQITYLEELKKSLISDVVTGKIDVRDIKIPNYKKQKY